MDKSKYFKGIYEKLNVKKSKKIRKNLQKRRGGFGLFVLAVNFVKI